MNKMLDSSRINNYLCSMNKLPIEKKKQIINLLVEGSSLRSISRICDVSPLQKWLLIQAKHVRNFTTKR